MYNCGLRGVVKGQDAAFEVQRLVLDTHFAWDWKTCPQVSYWQYLHTQLCWTSSILILCMRIVPARCMTCACMHRGVFQQLLTINSASM